MAALVVVTAAMAGLVLALTQLKHAGPSPNPPFRSMHGVRAFIDSVSQAAVPELTRRLCGEVPTTDWGGARLRCTPKHRSLSDVTIDAGTAGGERYLIVDIRLREPLVVPWSDLRGVMGKMQDEPELLVGHTAGGGVAIASTSYKFAYADPDARVHVWLRTGTTQDGELARISAIEVNVEFP